MTFYEWNKMAIYKPNGPKLLSPLGPIKNFIVPWTHKITYTKQKNSYHKIKITNKQINK